MERIAYIKYFLETEGALFLKLSQIFRERGHMTYTSLKAEIKKIFVDIVEGYIDIASDLRARMRIRETFRDVLRQKKGYDRNTLPHKVKPHIQALSDLGFLSIEVDDQEETYKPTVHGTVSPLCVLGERLESLSKMESVFSNDGYFPVIAAALDIDAAVYSAEPHEEMLRRTLAWGYDVMRAEVTGMADIDALVDWARIKLLSEENILAAREDILDYFSEMRRLNPAAVRYHMDGTGKTAYVILSLDEAGN